MLLNSQKGTSTLMLIIVLIILTLLGFVAFKLYVEPSKIPVDEIKAPKNEARPNDSFSLRSTQPESASQSLANPASINCTEKGGELTIMKNGSGGEFGLCNFEDNQSCEEWALYRGECPEGGVKTTGFDTVQESYCAWLGGQTEAVENAQCNLPNGNTCPVDALWDGTCS